MLAIFYYMISPDNIFSWCCCQHLSSCPDYLAFTRLSTKFYLVKAKNASDEYDKRYISTLLNNRSITKQTTYQYVLSNCFGHHSETKNILGTKFAAKLPIWQSMFGNYTASCKVLNPLHPHISMHILNTVFYSFSMVLTRRICLIIKSCFCWWSFLLFL